MWYWHKPNDKEPRGPVSFDQLKQLAENGELVRDDKVWTESYEVWVLASSVPDLFHTPPPIVLEHSSTIENENTYNNERLGNNNIEKEEVQIKMPESDQPTENKIDTWSLTWRSTVIIAIVVFLLFEANKLLNRDTLEEIKTPENPESIFWSTEERVAFIDSCIEASFTLKHEHGFNDDQIDYYCSCAFKELSSIFPNRPPTISEMESHAVSDIISKCMERTLAD